MTVAGQELGVTSLSGGVMIRSTFRGWMLLLAVGVLLAAPGKAQPQQAPRASKHAKSSSKAAAQPVEPVLEPKAIDILKAAASRLGAAHSMTFTA
jgi:hypothetical protein